ncbi:hypothetical protein NT017_34500 [Prolixibacter sp. NT017]|nr:hypothetical protein NT017_34500 [Prolixibacter sp. NT017]
MQHEGNLIKMRTEAESPVRYFLPLGGEVIAMNDLIGNQLTINFSGQINCIHCGKKTKRSFGQGFCYQCFQTAPEADPSVMRPELSRSHLGIARDLEWAQKHDLIDHYVYLAVTDALKVGVTRHHQVPTRWIDQGASYAIKLAKTPNRHIAGVIEAYLKNYLNDKTNWRAMLRNEVDESVDLADEKERVATLLPEELQKYLSDEHEITSLTYPVEKFPDKIKSISLDKTNQLEGVLSGIKGQYLIFDDDRVFNVRAHNGYFVELKA